MERRDEEENVRMVVFVFMSGFLIYSSMTDRKWGWEVGVGGKGGGVA